MVNSIKDSETKQKSTQEAEKKKDEVIQTEKRKLICKHRTSLKPRCVTFINISSETPNKEIVTEPLNDKALCQVLPALYRNPKKVAMINESNEDVWLQKGSRIGHFNNGTKINLEDLKKCKVHEVIQEVKEQSVEEGKEEIFNEKDEVYLSVIEGLKITEDKLLKKNPMILEELKKILFRYRNVFSAPGDVENEIGLTDLIEFKIELKPDVQPKSAKPRPLNPDQRASLKAQIEKWKRQSQIIECDSPWAAPLVHAKKAGEPGVISWAVDFRDINEKTISSSYPLPRISDNLEKLGGSRFFTTLDASSAYNTIPVEKESQKYLSFCSFLGTYAFTRMPFGHKNSPSTYARFVDLCLQKLRSESTIAYLDDIILFNKELKDHVKELEKVLQMHEKAGIKLRAKKSHLFQEEVNYLGYTVSQEGISMRSDYVETICNWKLPETGKGLQKFLGFCGYYCSFIKKFSYLTCEMQAAKKLAIIPWTKEMLYKFKTLKEKFREKPVRHYPVFNKKYPFKLTTDFSQIAIAGILSQEIPDRKGELVERFIGCVARKTTPYENNYGSVKGELAALVFAIRKFEHILRYNKFLVETNAQALRNLREPKGVYFRWLEELAGYDFTVKYKKGVTNINADALSRNPELPLPSAEEVEEESQEFVLTLK